jgi:hypothetical protein
MEEEVEKKATEQASNHQGSAPDLEVRCQPTTVNISADV